MNIFLCPLLDVCECSTSQAETQKSQENLPHSVFIPGSRVRSSSYLGPDCDRIRGKRDTVVMRGALQRLCLETAKVEVPYFVKRATSRKRSVPELWVYVRIQK